MKQLRRDLIGWTSPWSSTSSLHSIPGSCQLESSDWNSPIRTGKNNQCFSFQCNLWKYYLGGFRLIPCSKGVRRYSSYCKQTDILHVPWRVLPLWQRKPGSCCPLTSLSHTAQECSGVQNAELISSLEETLHENLLGWNFSQAIWLECNTDTIQFNVTD